MIKMMLLAGAGGFVGTCGRFLIGKWSSAMFHGAFPMGTFLVNIIGWTPLRTIGESTCHDTGRKCHADHRFLRRFHDILIFRRRHVGSR